MFSRFRKRQQLSPGIYRGRPHEDEQAARARWRYIVLLAAFTFLVIVVTKRINIGTQEKRINTEGKVAQETIIAEIDFLSEDIEKTRNAREAAAARVPDAFVVDDEKVARQLAAYDEMVQRIDALKPEVEAAVTGVLEQAFPDEAARTAAIAKAVRTVAQNAIERESALQGLKPETLAVWLSPSVADEFADDAGSEAGSVIVFPHFDPLAKTGRAALEDVLAFGVLAADDGGSEFSSKDADREILVNRRKPALGQAAEEEIPLTQVPVLDAAPNALRSRLSKAAQDLTVRNQADDRIRLQDAAFEVARLFLSDTMRFDSETTTALRNAARNHVEPVMKEIMAQEEIVRKGQRWTPQLRLDADRYAEERARYEEHSANLWGAILAHMIIVGLILLAFVRALPWLHRDEEHRLAFLYLALLIICTTAAVGRLVTYFTDKGFIVPVAAGAILLAILTNARVAGFSSVVMAVLVSIEFDYSWQVLVFATAMSFTGVMSIYRVRKRSDMGNASVKATLIGVLIVTAFSLAQGTVFASSTLYLLMMVAVNGVFCLGLVPAVLPTLERLFGITTDIQLLEYSDLNNPVLSRLAMEVPATYAHSLMIGQLAEAAADAIGANGLMARVCAYYHDIGKMKRPEYFVENQTGANIHDDMSPRLSARAIASHVTEGAEMARELHLPKPIIDGILEHHGTCLISFFYKEAVAQSKHGGVSEADFRYPGPRPRRRETAILMICDAVESAVRTLKNPNEERIREMVDRIIASRASDRQFDECDLTLKDLDTIAEVVTKRVASTQHRRLAYPDQKPEPPAAANVVSLSGGHE